MTDVHPGAERSRIMALVKSNGNKATELRLIAVLKANGIVGWRRNRPLFGRPDFLFPHSKVAVFVDGCFWHGCPVHGSIPKNNNAFWRRKLRRNQLRDIQVNTHLKRLGYRVVRIWQHELKNEKAVALRLRRALRRAP